MATTIAISAIDEHAISYALLGVNASHTVNHNRLRYIDMVSRQYGVIAYAH